MEQSLLAEIDDILDTRPVTVTDLPRLAYLELDNRTQAALYAINMGLVRPKERL